MPTQCAAGGTGSMPPPPPPKKNYLPTHPPTHPQAQTLVITGDGASVILAIAAPADPNGAANHGAAIVALGAALEPGEQRGPRALALAHNVDALLPLFAQATTRALLKLTGRHDAAAL